MHFMIYRKGNSKKKSDKCQASTHKHYEAAHQAHEQGKSHKTQLLMHFIKNNIIIIKRQKEK